MKITKVYTRTGDEGETSLVGGVRTSKADIRIDAYGTVDELNSLLGALAAQLGNTRESDALERIQNMLFRVATHLATDQSKTALYPSALLPDGETDWLEQQIDTILEQLPQQQGFILPGGTPAAATAHVCRTVCRRAERRVVALAAHATVGSDIIIYLNRLSDYLFVLARKINFIAGKTEKLWRPSCG